jgi:hypothetical protein
MVEIVIVAVIVLLVLVGFWWTRGAPEKPSPGADPTNPDAPGVTPLGDPAPMPIDERAEHEHEIE